MGARHPQSRDAPCCIYRTEQYLSLAASADRRRLVASVANRTASLYTVPILDRPAGEKYGDVQPMTLPTGRALMPRLAGRSLFYMSSQGTGDGLWRFKDGGGWRSWSRTKPCSDRRGSRPMDVNWPWS